MKKLMKRSLIARLLATAAETGLIALYLLNVISTGTFVPLIVIVSLLFWSFGVKRKPKTTKRFCCYRLSI